MFVSLTRAGTFVIKKWNQTSLNYLSVFFPHAFLVVMSVLTLSSCIIDNRSHLYDSLPSSSSTNSGTISGKLSGYSATNSSSLSLSSISTTSVSSLSCSSPLALLYKLDSDGDRIEPALATSTVSKDGSYSFNIKNLGLNIESPKKQTDPLIVSISGCSEGVYLRPITGAKDQNVTMGTTVLSYVLNTSRKNKMITVLKQSNTDFSSLIQSLDKSKSMQDAYQLLLSESSLKSKFTKLFDGEPAELEQAAPEIISSTLPSVASELIATRLLVKTTHFSTKYSQAYAWKLDDNLIGSQPDWQWTPGANQQGTHMLTLIIGEDDGTGSVDMSKPTKVLTQNLVITDNVLATAPSISVSSPTIVGTNPVNTRSLTLALDIGVDSLNCASFSALALTENISTVPNANAFTLSCSNYFNYTLNSQGDGQKTLRLWAINANGTISANPSVVSLYLDTGLPTVSISTTLLAIQNSSSQIFTFNATDNGGVIDHYECQIDSGSWAACSSPKSYSSLTEGNHAFSVKAIDTAGNVSNVDNRTWHIDLSSPVLSLATIPNPITNQLVSTVTFSASDTGGGSIAGYLCNLDNSGYTSCASPFSQLLSAGAHNILIKAFDTAGNYSNIESASWTIDTSLPTVTLIAKPSLVTSALTATFSFTGADTGGGAVASYECRLDLASYSACTSPYNLSGLAAGAHSVQIRAIDNAGNVGNATTYSWTIDTTAPSITLSSTPAVLTSSTSASFSFSATDSGGGSIASYSCKLDSSSYTLCTSPQTYSGLSAGTHQFYVTATDSVGNTSTPATYSWTIDTTAPSVTLTSVPNALTNLTSASFDFSAVDAGGGSISSYQCSMDSGGWSVCSSPKSYSSLTQGSHSFSIVANDSVGNISSVVTYNWTIDTTAPTVTLSSAPNSLTNSTSASFSFSGTDLGGGTVASYECDLDNSGFSNCVSPKVYSALTSAVHTFQVRAVDSAGNSGTSVNHSWTVDTSTPIASINSGPPLITNLTTANFSFSANPPPSGSIMGYECSLDNASWSACSSPMAYASLTAGSHSFQIRSIDNNNNRSAATTQSWTIDTSQPVVSIDTHPSSLTANVSASFSFSASDTGGGTVVSYSCKLDSGSYSSCSSPQSYSSLTSGAHTFYVFATDSAGNTSTVMTNSWSVDLTGPSSTISSHPASLTNDATASFAFSAVDTGGGSVASYSCKLDSGVYSNCTSPQNYSSLTQGSHSFQVYATDSVGNVGTTQTFSWTVDLTSPVVTLSSTPTSVTNSTSASFSFSATDTGGGTIASYNCKVDSGSYTSCTSPQSYSSLASGTHTFYVQATDSAGNISSTQSYAWEIDTTAPSLNIITYPTSLNNLTSVNFTFAATDSNGVASYSCKLDSGFYTNCSSPMSYSSLAQGSHTFYVQATDTSGNVSAAQTYTWITDLTPPTTSLTANPAAVTNLSSASFSFSASDSGGGTVAGYQCSLDSSAYTSCSSPKSYAGLTEGAHQLAIVSFDSASNFSSPLVYSWTIDQTAPTMNVSSAPSSPTNSTTASFTFSATDTGGGSIASYSCKIDSGSYANCTSPLSYSSLTAGTHIFYVTATDTAGNTSSVATVNWNIDLTAPTVAITTPASNGSVVLNSNLSSYTVSGTCSENGLNVSLAGSLSATATCSGGSWTTNLNLSGLSDGTLSLTASQTDAAGNTTSTAARTFIKDNLSPAISIATPIGLQGNVSTGSVTWTLTEANAAAGSQFLVEIYNGSSWSNVGSVNVTAGNNSSQNYSLSNFAVPSINITTARIRVSLTDAAGNIGTNQTSDFTIDSTVPSIASLTLNGGSSTTSTNIIQIALSASEDLFNITDFCLKYSTGVSAPTAPSTSDNCWTPVNSPSPGISPSLNISFSGFFYSLGLSSGTYKVYAWVRNSLKASSALSNSGAGTLGVDYGIVTYSAGVPPVLINVAAANSDTHQTPPIASELSVTSGSNVYVKWKASDDQALPSTPITISYTTNESTYVTLVSNLANTQGAGCTVDGSNYTGCYVITAPTSSYFKIRVSVTDSSQMTSVSNAPPNNTGVFNLLAGNTELGIGGSANSAIFNTDSNSTVSAATGALVVTDSGVIFIRDLVKGILKIDPQNGIVQSFLPYTATLVNGAIGTATLFSRYAYMTLDYSNNLIIYDYDRIRKVNLTTNTVTTLIGGGATRADGTLATSFSLSGNNALLMPSVIPLPNGDIYFYDNLSLTTGKTIWKYSAADQKVYGIVPTGTGITNKPVTDDVSTSSYIIKGFSLEYSLTDSSISTGLLELMPSTCPGCGTYGYPAYFNAYTGNTITSPTPAIAIPATNSTYAPRANAHDGKIYLIGQESSSHYKVVKLNSQTNTWTTVLGNGRSGFCPDGTDALSCSNKVMDVFVAADGKIYFTDNGLIRVVDENNKVQTLFGQRRVYGDGGLALSARINQTYYFDITSTGDIIFADSAESLLRKFTPGGNINLFAGNGTNTVTTGVSSVSTGLNLKWWGGATQMLVNRTNDDVYMMMGNYIAYKVQNSDGKLYSVFGGGATAYDAADGLVGASVKTTYTEAPELLALNPSGQLMATASQRNGSAQNYKCYAKLYDINDSFRQSHLAGNTNVCVSAWPADGSLTSSADVGYTSSNLHLMGQWFSDLSGWIIPRNGNNILKAYIGSGNITTVATLPRGIQSFTIVKNASNQNVVYYCASTGGKVYKYNIATSTETLLPWPNTAYSCTGFTIKYHTGRGSVVFPYTKDGVPGFAEIVDTP